MNILSTLHRAFRRYPDRAALSDRNTTLTYSEVEDRTNRTAGALATIGIDGGDTVAICAGDSVHVWTTIFAAWQIGALPALVDPRTPVDRLPYFVEDIGSAVIACDDALAGTLVAMGAPATVDISGLAESDVVFEDRGAHDEHSPLFLSYTSGTTGDPKGVVLTSGSVTLATSCIAERLGYRSDDVLIATTPIASSFQLVSSIMPAIHVGAEVVLCAGLSPAEIWAQIHGRDGTVLVAYPLTLADIVGDASSNIEHHLRLALSGGSPLAPRIKRDFQTRLGIPLVESYGQSELGGFMVLGSPSDGEGANDGYAGRSLPDRLAYVEGPDGVESVAGTIGEIVVADGFFGAYRNKKAEFERTTAGGVLHTGDLGVEDHGGRIKVLGRVQEGSSAELRGGFLRSVEDAAYEHESVRHAAVVLSAGGTIHCFVEAGDNGLALAPDDAAAALRDRLPDQLHPESVTVLDEMPRTFSGKANRLALSLLHGA